MEQKQRKFKHKKLGYIAFVNNIFCPIFTDELKTRWVDTYRLEFLENSQDWEEIIEIPEYVKATTSTEGDNQVTNGKIYKTINGSTTERYRFIDNNGRKNGWNATNFIPSTKEEFEAQNKPKVIIHKMYASNGNFELEISKDGIYYKPEESWLSTNDIDRLTTLTPERNMWFGPKANGYLTNCYTLKFDKIDVGCKKDTKIEDWKKALEIYNSLQ